MWRTLVPGTDNIRRNKGFWISSDSQIYTQTNLRTDSHVHVIIFDLTNRDNSESDKSY